MNVSKCIINYLLGQNIDTYFLVTGGAIAPFVDELGQTKGAKYYCFHHEQAAAMAAEGYYRTSGKMGVVLSTSGPGAQNLLNGICGCYYESIPVLFITGQVSQGDQRSQPNIRQVGFQEMPVVESFKHFTKFASEVNPFKVEYELKEAIFHAKGGRKGPVLLDIAVNVQTTEIEEFNNEPYHYDGQYPSQMIINSYLEECNVEILSALNDAKRPLILIGAGVKHAGAEKIMERFILESGIPYVTSWGGVDVIPEGNKYYLGNIGVYGDRQANWAIQSCDFLLSIGSRLDTRQTGGDLKTFARKAFKVMVDIDIHELTKDRVKVDLIVEADAFDFLEKLYHIIPTYDLENTWLEQCEMWNTQKIFGRVFDNGFNPKQLPPTTYEVLKHINTLTKENDIIIPDQGGNLVWTMQSLSLKKGQKLFSNFGNSSMGWSLPASIGASIGSDQRIISINGDGGFQMNIQELQTIIRYNLPIKILIINNNSYGIIKQFQDSYFGERYIATEGDDYSAPDFCKIGEAYGIKSFHAGDKNWKKVLSLVFKEKGCILCNITVDQNQKIIPKLDFGNSLENMSPHLDPELIKQNMFIEPLEPNKEKGWKN